MAQFYEGFQRLQGSGVESWNTSLLRDRFLSVINSEIHVLNTLYHRYESFDLESAMTNIEHLHGTRDDAIKEFLARDAPDMPLNDASAPPQDSEELDAADYVPTLEQDTDADSEEDDDATVTATPQKRRKQPFRQKKGKRSKKTV